MPAELLSSNPNVIGHFSGVQRMKSSEHQNSWVRTWGPFLGFKVSFDESGLITQLQTLAIDLYIDLYNVFFSNIPPFALTPFHRRTLPIKLSNNSGLEKGRRTQWGLNRYPEICPAHVRQTPEALENSDSEIALPTSPLTQT